MPTMNVLNRYSDRVEIQFDAAYNPESPYVWEPGEVKALPQDVALFVRRKSVVREDPVTGKQTRALVVEGIDQEYEGVVTSGEFLPFRGPELLDRSNMPKKDQEIQYVNLGVPLVMAGERESASVESHARRPQA